MKNYKLEDYVKDLIRGKIDANYAYDAPTNLHRAEKRLIPKVVATNFSIRLTRDMAHQLISEGDESVMCKEYGQDEDWVGLTMDDLDPDTMLLDDDYETFESWCVTEEHEEAILDRMLEEAPLNSITEYLKLLNVIQ